MTTAPHPTILIAISELLDSPWEPAGRRARGAEELSASIREHGVIDPLIVRPHLGGTHEIVCGHRRRHAAALANKTEVPCIVRELSDDQARELMLVENVQRVDVTPLEEAESYGQMREDLRWSPERIAARVGKAPSHVYRRLALLKLEPLARLALADGRLPLGAAEQLASVANSKDAADALTRLLASSEPPPKRVALAIIDDYRRPLSSAPWSLVDASLGAPACSTCPKRTRAQAQLFDDADAADRCLDGGCWTGKKRTLDERNAKAQREREEEEDDRPTTREPKASTKPAMPPSYSMVDHEPRAIEIAIERALPLIAKKIADPKRKLDDAKIWRLVAGLIVRGVHEGHPLYKVFQRRFGLPPLRGAVLGGIAGMNDPRIIAGLVVEILCEVGDWNGTNEDEGPILAAARFCNIDLMVHKADALEELRATAAPKAPKAPKVLEEKGSPKAAASKKPGKTKAEHVLEETAPEKPALASNEIAKQEALAVGQRVKINGGEFRGRAGVIEKVPKMFGDFAYVLLDRVGKERTDKTKLISHVHLELEMPAAPGEKPESKAIELTVDCETCKVKVGALCKKDGGGFHVQRTRAAVELRDGTGRPEPLKTRLLTAAKGIAFEKHISPTKVTPQSSGNPKSKRLPSAKAPAAKKPDPAGNPSPDVADERQCLVCGCTETTPCETAQGPCGWAEPGLCSACDEIMEDIEDLLSDGAKPEQGVVLWFEDDLGERFTEKLVRDCIQELIDRNKVQRFADGKIALKLTLPAPKAETKPAEPAKRGRGRPKLSKKKPKS